MVNHICTIDDDPIYKLIIKKIINRAGIFQEHTHFSSAVDAIEKFKDREFRLPNIILLDINMPQMDGWEFIEKMRKIRPGFSKHTKVYIVSSSISEVDREKAELIEEVSAYITKPLHKEKLMTMIKVEE